MRNIIHYKNVSLEKLTPCCQECRRQSNKTELSSLYVIRMFISIKELCIIALNPFKTIFIIDIDDRWKSYKNMLFSALLWLKV